MVGKTGGKLVQRYYSPADKLNNFYVNEKTSFRNKKRLWRKLLQREKNVR